MREFNTGATRNLDDSKLDYEGFLSPLVLERFAKYMHTHRIQEDGNVRDSDNWQKGIPKDSYIKSLWRHHMDVWKNHRGLPAEEDLETAICASIFNLQGYLHEHLKNKAIPEKQDEKKGSKCFSASDLFTQSVIPVFPHLCDPRDEFLIYDGRYEYYKGQGTGDIYAYDILNAVLPKKEIGDYTYG